MLWDRCPSVCPVGYWTTRGYANSRIANSRTRQLADWTTRGLDNSRTGQLADWTSRGLVNSRTRQLADWTTRGCNGCILVKVR